MGLPLIAYSIQDPTSVIIARRLFEILSFEETSIENGMRRFNSSYANAIELNIPNISAEFLDSVGAKYIVFLSRHSSAKGIPSFTTHAEGNWSTTSDLGGKPHMLSVASPESMLALLKGLEMHNTYKIEVTYEATHHGPLLSTPSMFVEIGGSEETLAEERFASVVAESVADLLAEKPSQEYSKVVLGIGSNHYPRKFSSLALEKGYAFSHIMPRYYTSEVKMLGQAVSRSTIEPEAAVIEWKSINSVERNMILKELENLGIDYEAV
ncbi:MAG: D-aminoacyl-tRNA deacylase [Candidatus Micrarchaeia archaeon]